MVHQQYISNITQALFLLLNQKIVIPIVEHISICVCFLLEIFGSGNFVPKYDNSSIMPADMCTKSCSVPIINRGTKFITGFRFYPTSDIELYQLMILYEFVMNSMNYGEFIM